MNFYEKIGLINIISGAATYSHRPHILSFAIFAIGVFLFLYGKRIKSKLR